MLESTSLISKGMCFRPGLTPGSGATALGSVMASFISDVHISVLSVPAGSAIVTSCLDLKLSR